jgi:intein/homing endonuclease
MANDPKNLREVIKEEYRKCLLDPMYFMKKYVKIQHQTRGIIPFELYPFQENALQEFIDFDRTIVLKSRQMGISTLCSAYALWTMIFNPGKNVLIISTKQDTSKEIVSKIRLANNNLPSWLKIQTVEDNRLSLKFKNESKVEAASSSSDSVRGKSAYLLILDECAFIDGIEDIWTSAQQTMATGGRAILLSTPNGVGNFFHKTWVDAVAKKNQFHTINLRWNLHPDRDQTWRDRQTIELGAKKAAQECFSSDVIVYTYNGPKKISDIKIGDKVLTHNGRFKNVNYLFKHSKLTKKISSTNNYIEKFVTENHPFLTDDSWKPVGNITDSDIIFTFPTENTISSSEQTLDIYNIMEPKYFKKILCENDSKFYINDRKHKTVCNRYIKIGYDFGYILGLYLAEGSGNRLRKTFNFDYKKEKNGWPEKIKIMIENLFGLSNHNFRLLGNTGHLSFCSEVFSYMVDMFCDGGDCYSKKLSKFSYQVMNKELAKGIVDGVFRGDGCLKKEYNKKFVTSSESLFYDVSYLLNLLSITDFSMRKSKTGGNIGFIEGRKYVESPMWEISVRKTKNIDVTELSDIVNIPISNQASVTLSDGQIRDVYNLSVEDDNSYVTEYGIVHNCDCEFLSSGNTVVEINLIEELKKNAIDPIETRGSDYSFWIWERPDMSKNYLISADVARGDGNDYSAFQVIEPESMAQVAEFKGVIGTKEYGNMLVAVATEYNTALLVIENSTYGWAVIQQVIDRGYPNLFYSSADLQYVDVEQHATNRLNALDKKMVPGFTNSTKTRPLAIEKLETCIREKVFNIRSNRLLDELSVFVWHNGKAEAMRGYNDDLVISAAIGLWIRDTALRLRREAMDVNRVILSGIKRTGYDNSNSLKYTKNSEMAQKSWTFETGREKNQSLNWLL